MSDAIWYYVDRNRQRVGPVTAAAIAEAYRLGQVDGQSLVWREGMAEWVALAHHWSELGLVGPPAIPPAMPPSPHAPPAPLGPPTKSSAGPWLIGCGLFAFLFFIVLPILAAIALPAYQDYVIRSQVTSVLADIRGYVTAAEEIHSRTGSCPAGNADVGAPAEVASSDSTRMTLIAVGEDFLGQCVISGTLVGGNPKADGTEVRLVRDDDGAWECTIPGLEQKYLPTGCFSE